MENERKNKEYMEERRVGWKEGTVFNRDRGKGGVGV